MPKPLPPPPSQPALSPPVTIAGEEATLIQGLPGEPALEAAVRVPLHPMRAVILCHPHPLYGGTQHSAVIVAIAKALAAGELANTVASMRFNYRGVGKSGGAYGEGRGEVLDVRAAIRAMKPRTPGVPLTVCGYSFGTWVGLRAAVLEGGVERVMLVAPAVRIFDFVKEDGLAFPGRIAIVVGDRDEFCDLAEARALAEALGASLTVQEDADHYFLRSRQKLAQAVVPFLIAQR